jgi:GR25 family glycosyltransferase involved in LPS biosynthesis
MNCHYINLSFEHEKRHLIEANFHQFNSKKWVLNRFEAIDKNFVQTNQVKGQISDGAKGCFLSHRALMNQHIQSDSHLYIVEDDVVFCNKTQHLVEKVTSLDSMDWDMLYTDVCIPQASQMMTLYQLKQECTKEDQLRVLDLAQMNFASTAAYIVNKKSIAKVAALLNAPDELNIPIDLYYRSLVHSGELKAFVTFPFLTSLSSRSEDSNIQTAQHAYTELVWHSFRKLIWMDGKTADIQRNLDLLEQGFFTSESRAFATILASTFSNDFILK